MSQPAGTPTQSGSRNAEGPAWHGRLAHQLRQLTEDRALAAQCRSGLSTEPGLADQMWNVMGSVLNDSESTEEQRRIKDWEFQRVADAVHYALALCATHQQSRSVPAHVTGQSLGAAARRLGQRMNSADGAATRFRAAATADTLEELVGHLRGLVPLLRSKDVRLDYVNLARAMAAWPDPFRRARFVKRWGMDFYRSPAAPASAGADTPEE